MESLKLHNLYSIALTCICISFWAEQWELHTKHSTILFHFLIHAYSTTLFTFNLLMREWTERNKTGLPYFLPCHHFQCKWLAKPGRQHGGYIEFLAGPCLESHSFFLCWNLLIKNEASPGCQCLHWLSCKHNEHTPLLALNITELHTLWILQNSVLMGHSKHYIQMHWQRMVGMHIKHICSAHTHVPLSH